MLWGYEMSASDHGLTVLSRFSPVALFGTCRPGMTVSVLGRQSRLPVARPELLSLTQLGLAVRFVMVRLLVPAEATRSFFIGFSRQMRSFLVERVTRRVMEARRTELSTNSFPIARHSDRRNTGSQTLPLLFEPFYQSFETCLDLELMGQATCLENDSFPAGTGSAIATAGREAIRSTICPAWLLRKQAKPIRHILRSGIRISNRCRNRRPRRQTVFRSLCNILHLPTWFQLQQRPDITAIIIVIWPPINRCSRPHPR